jgi:hypothetical protein
MQLATEMRRCLGIVLVCLLIAQSVPAQQPLPVSAIRQSVGPLPSNARVVVQLKDGTSARGPILSRTDEGFALEEQRGGQAQNIVYKCVRVASQGFTLEEKVDHHRRCFGSSGHSWPPTWPPLAPDRRSGRRMDPKSSLMRDPTAIRIFLSFARMGESRAGAPSALLEFACGKGLLR